MCKKFTAAMFTVKLGHSSTQDSTSNVSLDFGLVGVGDVAVEHFYLKNASNTTKEFSVKRDSDTNAPNYEFHVKPAQGFIKPGEEKKIGVHFTPLHPQTTFFDYFDVLTKGDPVTRIAVKGEGAGPKVCVSASKLTFLASSPGKEIRRFIELKNYASVVAYFQFDVDEKQSIFKVNQLEGSIKAEKHIYVEITFTPPDTGVFRKYLYCLVNYHQPILLDLIGICAESRELKLKKVEFVKFPRTQSVLAGGYSGYVNDCVHRTLHPPPVSLSVTHIDFGQRDTATHYLIPHHFSATNHQHRNVTLKWNNHNEELFRIRPEFCSIPGRSSVLFEAFFCPSEPDNFYACYLTALVFLEEKENNEAEEEEDEKEEEEGEVGEEESKENKVRGTVVKKKVYLPHCLTIRLIGHSFPADSYTWTPQYSCPTELVMPTFIPCVPVYSSFMIKRAGHLPLMFKFIPPPTSHCTIKPVEGLITREYQIIVVQFCSVGKEENLYIETWTLQFNCSDLHEIKIEIQALAQNPLLEIGRHNEVIFPPTYAYTEQSINVKVKNKTRHCISYDIQIPEEVKGLSILDKSGTVACNEERWCLWQGVPQLFGKQIHRIRCRTRPECLPELLTEFSVTVFTEGESVDLCALPNYFMCGSVICGSMHSLSFHLFNIGHCKKNFKLVHIDSKDTKDIEIIPDCGSLEENSKVLISVSFCTSQLGDNSFDIAYYFRKNSESIEPASDMTTTIVTVHYVGILPTLEIHDLEYISSSSFFTKLDIWTMMNINKLNEELKNVCTDGRGKVQMYFPHGEVNSMSLIVYLLIKNNSEFETEWSLKRLKKCDCKIIEGSKSLSLRYRYYDCPHRSIFTIWPTSGVLQPHKEDLLRLTVNYCMLGINELAYVLYLCNNREIVITAQIFAFNEEHNTPSVYTGILQLKSIFIGNRHPPAQAYWLYNNSKHSATYVVDVTPLQTLRESNFNFKIITCLNPSGSIPPESCHAILFVFKPIQLQQYEVVLPLCLGKRWHRLKIIGDGAVCHINHLPRMRNKMPDLSRFRVNEMPVSLSVDHLVLKAFQTDSKKEELFRLDNISDCAIEYEWWTTRLVDVLMVFVMPGRGTIQPGESHCCRLTVMSQSKASLLTIPVICELLNITQRSHHEKAVEQGRILLESASSGIVITEAGVTEAPRKVVIPKKPAAFYRVLSVTCSVVNVLDLESQIHDKELLSFTPRTTIDVPNIRQPPELTSKMMFIIKEIFDRLIWDIIFSRRFKHDFPELCGETRQIDYAPCSDIGDVLKLGFAKLKEPIIGGCPLGDEVWDAYNEEDITEIDARKSVSTEIRDNRQFQLEISRNFGL